MKLKTLVSSLSAIGLGCGMALAAASAQASTLWSFEDDNIEFILRANTSGSLDLVTSGALAVGDVFYSVFEMGQFRINGGNALPAGKELTGVAAVQLKAIIGAGPGAQYIYGAYSGGGLGALLGEAWNPGSAIAMYINGTSGAGGDKNLDLNRSTNPATNCTSLADCTDQATRGELFQLDGYAGDPDEVWAATQILAGGGDIGTVHGTNNAVLIAAFNAQLSNFYNVSEPVEFINIATGLPCGNPGYIADGCVQVSVSGTVLGGQGLSNGANAHSDLDLQKYVAPEPGSLALLGAGLFGLQGLRRRQAKKTV